MARQLSLLCLAVIALLLLSCLSGAYVHAADAVLTEADFKKMKVKDLKKFLDDRSAVCAGCEEKSEFVRECLKVADKPVHPSKVKAEIPKLPLWEAWANVAGEVCEATADTKKASADAKKNVCANIRVATDAVFQQYGKRTANKLKKKPDALLKTSYGEIYQQAGRKMLTKLAGYCFKNAAKCTSASAIQALMEQDDKVKGVKFITYLTNVGIENTNPMYETMKDKSLNNDEL
jgi:hypothetical protein